LSLRLYNTRTRAVETFAPLRDREVRIYVCGMTPSAQSHLGHARSFLFFDVLRRYLAHLGYRVTYVQNVTDIDDRSIARGMQTGENWRDIVAGFYAEFKASIAKLGLLPFDEEPYATQFIPQIQAMILELIATGHAYATADGIYYRVKSFPNYGKLANRNVEELESGARIEVDERKEDPLDFALWKFAKPGEPKWPFEPHGDGRPGWHIECSAMSRDLLDREGVGFDIHGGGADLIFPHHENEIAQSEPLMKHPPMAKYWLHGGLLLFDNRKMSKSLGNFEPLVDLLGRHDPQAIRLLFLQTSYAKVKNFTEDSLAGAAAALSRLKAAYRLLHAGAPPPETQTSDLHATGYVQRVERDLDEDMNTAAALAAMLEFASNAAAVGERAGAGAALYEYRYLLTMLGLEPNAAWLEPPRLPDDFVERLAAQMRESLDGAVGAEQAIEHVIRLRTGARALKDWAKSDRLRDALLACGVEVKDSKEGTTWSIVGG
jgi:cysteinyl-tRNA synthetase